MHYIVILFVLFIVLAFVFKSFLAAFVIFAVMAAGIIAYRLYAKKQKEKAEAAETWQRKTEEAERERKREEDKKAAAEAKKKRQVEIAERFNNMLSSISSCDVEVDQGARKKFKKDCKKNAPDMSNVTKSSNLNKLCDFVVVDTETTGLQYQSDQIVELTAIRFRDWEPVEIFTSLVNPGRPIPEEASGIHGITDDMVENAPRIEEIIESFDKFIGDDSLVGHNLPFDLNFLDYAGSEYFNTKRKYYDTLTLAKLLDLNVDNNKLTTLSGHFAIRDNSSAHRSASDALASGLLFKKLVDMKVL